MIGEIGSHNFIIQTFSDEQKEEICKIIDIWALEHGYERLPDEYNSREMFDRTVSAVEKTILYGKYNPKNGERYIISYNEAREGLLMQFSLYVGTKTLMNETFTDTSVPITDMDTLSENMELKKMLIEATGGLEAIRANVRKNKKKNIAFLIVWFLIVIAIIVFVVLI